MLEADQNNPGQQGSGSPSGRLLTQDKFLPLSMRGFGDAWNAYLHGMTWFENKLYCGTFRANFCFLRVRKIGRPTWKRWPINCPDGSPLETLDCRAQIWQFNPLTAEWKNVYRAPIVKGKHGKDIAREVAYRGMVTFQGKSDSKPVLYATPFCTTQSPGPQFLRSEDGENFETCSEAGLGYEGINSFRALVIFKGKMYTSPIGMTGNIVNASRYPIVFESEDPASGDWRMVSTPGFGDPNNAVVFNLQVLGDYLYAGTMNVVTGFQIWKTDAEGPAPYRWTKVIDFGAYRGKFNEGIAAMAAFKGALYVGASIQDGGYDRINNIGPAGGEVIRIFPDDSWELVMGTSRLTPDGLKTPLSDLSAGFDSIFNGYIWRMAVHDDHLYVGTLNWAKYLHYVNQDLWPDHVKKMVLEWGLDGIIEKHGGFDIWGTGDGKKFSPVTLSGFDNAYNCGVRQLVSTPLGLCVGTVNPFGPDILREDCEGEEYEPNPRGGTEVWLGAQEHPKVLRDRPLQGVLPGQPTDFRAYRLQKLPPDAGNGVKQDAVPEELDPSRFEFTKAQLEKRASVIDLREMLSERFAEAAGLFDLKAACTEHLPKDGPTLVMGNNPAIPLFVGGTFVAAHAVYTLDAITDLRNEPGWMMTPVKYFELAERMQSMIPLFDKLGYFPGSDSNTQRLLEMGKAVLCYPEEKPSRPPYRMHPFSSRFIKIAHSAGVPITPVAFLGTHESHLLVEHENKNILVNKRRRLRTDYVIEFLPPIDVASELNGKSSDEAFQKIADDVRSKIEAVIEREAEKRPLITVAQHLQQRSISVSKAEDEG
ncbi:MAG: hypothetical protein AAF720_14225 [Pseudomonadota bacterium]